MESKSVGRFTQGKQSSLMPTTSDAAEPEPPSPEIPDTIRLMYLANEGDVNGIRELLDAGTDVNFRDDDGRTALHVAACQGFADVVEVLVGRGARVDAEDRWKSTPLADAMHYKYNEVIELLEKHGATLHKTPMIVKSVREVLEFEIDPKELDFSKSIQITKGTFRSASWRGIQVAVKTLHDDVLANEDKVSAFRDELALLQQIRHPNVVQFLGTVTQSSPMMIVTEYLPKGDLGCYLRKRGALKPAHAIKYALDIARGMSYLHERKPDAIIHRDLEPTNILRDDAGHLKVADFGVSRFLKVAKTMKEDKPFRCKVPDCRYIAPEVFSNEGYDTKADVFSFALILQEMIEGNQPFTSQNENEVPKSYSKKERPPFSSPPKLYPHGLKELIEECWNDNPASRPTFREIIDRLSSIEAHLVRKTRWKCFPNIRTIWKKESSVYNRSSRTTTHRV